jgi:hypothetical protein
MSVKSLGSIRVVSAFATFLGKTVLVLTGAGAATFLLEEQPQPIVFEEILGNG